MSKHLDTLTFLSPNVHFMLVGIPSNGVDRHDNCLQNALYNWDEIDKTLGNISGRHIVLLGPFYSSLYQEFQITDTENILSMKWPWFVEKVKIFWGIMESTVNSLSHFKEALDWELSKWLGDINLKEIYFSSFNSSLGRLEATLKLLPFLERALGNVYKLTLILISFL